MTQLEQHVEHQHRQPGKVTVTFNGGNEEFEYRSDEMVAKLLEEAKRRYRVERQHLLGLFTEGGMELKDDQTLEQAGVRPGDLLVLRQSTVKGGA